MCKEVDLLIKDIALKLSNIDYLESVMNDDDNSIQFNGGKIKLYERLSLSNGLPSLCMLYGELNEQFPNEGWDKRAHEIMALIGMEIESKGLSLLSMFSGAAGIGLATLCISKNKTRYSKFTSNINLYIKENIEIHMKKLSEKDSVMMHDYDIISGLSGIGSYCMLFKEDPQMISVLHNIIEYLLNICDDIRVNDYTVPGWFISAENQFTEEDRERWEEGCFNIGLAHGIPSILIFISNAVKLGIISQRIISCIKKIADFLIDFCIIKEEEYFWNSHISLNDYINKVINDNSTRDAWCYGTPGIAYALLIAGQVVGETKYIDYAIAGVKTSLKYMKNVNSPTFCHGYSGLAYIAQRFYNETKIEDFKVAYKDMYIKILEFYNEDAPFGFYDIDRDKEYNNVGIINGVVGILLTILSIKNNNKTPWDYAFLLSDIKVD